MVNRLEVGKRVRVISDAGGISRLILRSGPGLSTESLSYVEDDALLTILDGPIEADGYLWWSIETEGGRQGWVIEGTPTERTLLPLCAFTENRIAFTVNQYIYTSDENGANRCIFDRIRQTSYLTSLSKNLAWSADHLWLTYVDGELFRIRADGSQRIRITDKSNFYWLDWSPDNERIVAVDEREKLPQIWTLRADGSLLAVLTTNDQRKVWAGWLADSQTLLYAERATAGGYAFHSVNILAGGFREIFTTPLTISQPVLSPDRSRLLVSGEVHASDGSVSGQTYILDTQTGNVLLEFPLAFNGLWSPDGTRLISVEADAITILPLVAGSEPTRTALSMSLPLTDSTHALFDWLPDSRLRIIINGVFYYIDTTTAQVEQGAG